MNLFSEISRTNKAYCASLGLPSDTYDRPLADAEANGSPLSEAELHRAQHIQYRKRLCARRREAMAERRRYAPKYLDRLPFDEHAAREQRVRAGLFITRDGDTLFAPRAEPGWVEVGVAA